MDDEAVEIRKQVYGHLRNCQYVVGPRRRTRHHLIEACLQTFECTTLCRRSASLSYIVWIYTLRWRPTVTGGGEAEALIPTFWMQVLF